MSDKSSNLQGFVLIQDEEETFPLSLLSNQHKSSFCPCRGWQYLLYLIKVCQAQLYCSGITILTWSPTEQSQRDFSSLADLSNDIAAVFKLTVILYYE